jgi:hypothetical protein
MEATYSSKTFLSTTHVHIIASKNALSQQLQGGRENRHSGKFISKPGLKYILAGF